MNITVFARHINKYVIHGRTEGNTFIREIGSNCMRFSDHSFCINLDAIPKLDHFKIEWVEFRVRYAHEIKHHQIAYKDLEEFEVVRNEFGEENIRIPPAMTKVIYQYTMTEQVLVEKKKEKKSMTKRFLKDVRKHLGAVWTPPQ